MKGTVDWGTEYVRYASALAFSRVMFLGVEYEGHSFFSSH